MRRENQEHQTAILRRRRVEPTQGKSLQGTRHLGLAPALRRSVLVQVPHLHALSRDAVPAPLLHDEERDDDDVDVERRRLDLQAPLSLRPEEALRDGLLRESCNLASGALVRELGVGSVSSVFGRQR